MTVTDDIGADQTSRRTSAGAFAVLDTDGSLPHEAFIELGGVPAVTVQAFPEDDTKITVDGMEFVDIPRDSMSVFLRSVAPGQQRNFPRPCLTVITLLAGGARGCARRVCPPERAGRSDSTGTGSRDPV